MERDFGRDAPVPLGVHYRPVPQSEINLELMRLIDKQFLETPYYASGQMMWLLRRQGQEVAVSGFADSWRLWAAGDLPEATHKRASSGGIGNIRICCGIWLSTGPTRRSVPTSPIFRCGRICSTSWRSWTGRRARCCRGVCRTQWMRSFALRRSEMRRCAMAARRFQYGSGIAVHDVPLHRDTGTASDTRQHEWARSLAGRTPDEAYHHTPTPSGLELIPDQKEARATLSE